MRKYCFINNGTTFYKPLDGDSEASGQSSAVQ